MQLDLKTVVTVVSMIVAATSAFFAWQISTQEGINELENRIERLEGKSPPISKDAVTQLIQAQTKGLASEKQLDVLRDELREATEGLKMIIPDTTGMASKEQVAVAIETIQQRLSEIERGPFIKCEKFDRSPPSVPGPQLGGLLVRFEPGDCTPSFPTREHIGVASSVFLDGGMDNFEVRSGSEPGVVMGKANLAGRVLLRVLYVKP